LVIVISGPNEAPVMRSIAGAPAFIQLEGEDNLTRVERVVGLGRRCSLRMEDKVAPDSPSVP